MGDATTPRLMTKAAFAEHRSVSKPYISKLARNGILVMRGGKIDVQATDMVLDDRPVADIDPPSRPMRVAGDLGQAPSGASFRQARTIEMVFRARICRLTFETRVGKLIDAATVRHKIATEVRAFRDGLLGIPDRLSMILASERDARKIRLMLDTEFNRELDRLADALQNVEMSAVHLGAR
jgi:hypothetical protein